MALLRCSNFRFMLQPGKLFAPHPGTFTSELSSIRSPMMNVWYNYMSKYPILMAELSSASHIILQAAHQKHKRQHKGIVFYNRFQRFRIFKFESVFTSLAKPELPKFSNDTVLFCFYSFPEPPHGLECITLIRKVEEGYRLSVLLPIKVKIKLALLIIY